MSRVICTSLVLSYRKLCSPTFTPAALDSTPHAGFSSLVLQLSCGRLRVCAGCKAQELVIAVVVCFALVAFLCHVMSAATDFDRAFHN